MGEALTQQARPTFLILLATTGLVLLIACENVANLNLARVRELQQHPSGEYVVVLRDGTELKLSRARRERLQELLMGGRD